MKLWNGFSFIPIAYYIHGILYYIGILYSVHVMYTHAIVLYRHTIHICHTVTYMYSVGPIKFGVGFAGDGALARGFASSREQTKDTP